MKRFTLQKFIAKEKPLDTGNNDRHPRKSVEHLTINVKSKSNSSAAVICVWLVSSVSSIAPFTIKSCQTNTKCIFSKSSNYIFVQTPCRKHHLINNFTLAFYFLLRIPITSTAPVFPYFLVLSIIFLAIFVRIPIHSRNFELSIVYRSLTVIRSL